MINLPVENIADTPGLAGHHLHTAERNLYNNLPYLLLLLLLLVIVAINTITIITTLT
jgi:hypothetical protein